MKKIEGSLSKKIVLVVATVFIFISVVAYSGANYINKQTFYKLEKDKAQIIVQNYAPFMAMHLFIDTHAEVNRLSAQIMKNSNILRVKVYSENRVILDNTKDSIYKGIDVSAPIYQPNTNNKIGQLSITYSTRCYQKLVDKYFFLMLFGIFMTIIILILLNLYISKLLKPLKNLANIFKEYSADTKIDIPYLNEQNEIGLIANAMDLSQKKTIEYSINLQNLTQELIDKNLNLSDEVEKELKIIKEKDKQILHQSKLAQMGEMLSMIAHQWRQPLTAISSTSGNLSLQLMLQDDIDKEEFESELNLILEYSQHLSNTIDDFRDFFKTDKEIETTSFQSIIDDTLKIVKVSLENKNIELILDINSNKKINTYPNELKQVLLNLIKNAQDILLEKTVKNPTITLATRYDKGSHLLIIKDNAGGVPKKIIDKIFEPYFSTKLKKDGTGLGLYMSKTIIQEHCHGKLSVKNDSEGAVFTIELKAEVLS